MSLLNSREPSWGGTDYSHHSLASDPDWNGSDYSRSSVASNPCRTHPYLTTITNLGGILSTADHQPTDSLILPSTSSHYRTSFLTPATYVHHYEIEVARWYAHKQAKRKRPDHPLSCSICLEPMEPLAWVRPTALCTHEPRICEPCLGQLVAHDVEQGLTEVCCPDVECRHQMDRRDVRGRICEDPACLNRYNTLVAQRELESQPNFMWCQNPQCGRGHVYQEGGASPLVICQYCQSPACFTHRIPWHDGMTCEDYDLVIQRIQASEDYIGTHTKQCPSCRRPIEKLSGCDHMTCHRPGGCGHEFCWICLADYGPIFQEGNNRHNSDCRYHPENRASDRSYSPEPHIIGVQIYPPGSPSITTDTTSGSESSGFERVEWPPAPMPLRLNNSWENRTSTRSTRLSYDNAWRPAAPPRHYLRVIQEESDRRTSHGQSINSRAQQTSYAESSRSSHDIVWQPSTPPTPYLRESQPQEELDRRRSRGQTINSQAQRTSYVESSRSSYDIVCRLVIPPTPRLQDDQLPDKLVGRTRDGQSINSPSYIYAGSSRPSSYVARQPASPPTSHLQRNQPPEELDDRTLEVQALYTWAWRQGRTASWWPPTPPLPPSPPLPRGEENRNEDKRHGRVWEDTLST